MCGDRRENESGVAAEIEVTPEMIEAGSEFLWDDDVPAYKSRDEVLASIYRAMETARRSRCEGDG
jgi:hypothetical protein